MNRCFCNACAADLRGSLIPSDSLDMYGGHATCDGCGGARHYSRVRTFYDPDRGRTVAWRCPDCGYGEWIPEVRSPSSAARPVTDWGKNPPPVTVDWHRDHHGRWVAFVSVATREEVVVELMSHGARITVEREEEADRD